MRLARSQGVALLEVLVALVLISLGLLGMAGLQMRAQQAEIEAYQRAQAQMLAADIADRININRPARRCYAITTDTANGTPFVGTGNEPGNCLGWGTTETRDLADYDLATWDDKLEGATEQLSGSAVGALTDARGCVSFDTATEIMTVAVAWQGEAPTSAPTNNCAKGLYGDEKLRRVVTLDLEFADLD